MYRLIRDFFRDETTATFKDKVNAGEKLNLKSYKNDSNIKQEKCVNFSKEVTVFRG